MKKYTLEVCVDSVESALAAERGGADRIELCGNLIIGGTTPSPKLFEEIKKNSNIKIHVLIRPRFGDFCYTKYEYSIMKEEVKMFRQLGADGIVIGSLKPDGTLDYHQVEGLLQERGNMSVTLHRVFDMCANPLEALEQAVQLKIDTILTSGQKDNCLDGIEELKQLVACAKKRIDIMAGGGINAEVIKKLYWQTGLTTFHMSGKKVMDSPMIFRKKDVHMGMKGFSEYEIYQTDEEQIKNAVKILK